jgi:hypothetical protein
MQVAQRSARSWWCASDSQSRTLLPSHFFLPLTQNQLEHILAKPGMYIGSNKVDSDEAYWVFNSSAAGSAAGASSSSSSAAPKKKATKKKKKASSDSEDEDSSSDCDFGGAAEADASAAVVAPGPRMEYRKVKITPGLYKLFDEILVNAADNKQRDKGKVIMDSTYERGVDTQNGE